MDKNDEKWCDHSFHTIEQITRPAGQNDARSTASPIAQRWHDEHGVRVGCALCGEIRVVWATGTIQIEVPGHDPSNS